MSELSALLEAATSAMKQLPRSEWKHSLNKLETLSEPTEWWRVELKLILGEFEKYVTRCIKADTYESATLRALEEESHSNGGLGSDGNWWDAGQFIYKVHDWKQLTELDVMCLEHVGEILPKIPRTPPESQFSKDKGWKSKAIKPNFR